MGGVRIQSIQIGGQRVGYAKPSDIRVAHRQLAQFLVARTGRWNFDVQIDAIE